MIKQNISDDETCFSIKERDTWNKKSWGRYLKNRRKGLRVKKHQNFKRIPGPLE